MAQVTSWVRQHTMRELMDDTFDLYKERVPALLLAGILPYLPVVIFSAAMRPLLPGNLLGALDSFDAVPAALGKIFQNVPVMMFILAVYLLNGIAFLVSTIVQCRIAIYHALGMPLPWRKMFSRLAKPVASLFVVAIPASFIISMITCIVWVVVMMLGGILVAIFFSTGGGRESIAIIMGITSLLGLLAGLGVSLIGATYFLTAPTALAVEHCGPFAAMGRSFQIAGTNMKAHCVAAYVVSHVPAILLILAMGIGGGLAYAISFLAPTVSAVALSTAMAVGSAAAMGVFACLQALTYLDGRCRRDALDLLLLAQEIGLGDEFARALNLQQARPSAATTPNYAWANYAAPPPTPTPVDGLTMPPPAQDGAFDYSAPPPPLAPAAEETVPPDATPVDGVNTPPSVLVGSTENKFNVQSSIFNVQRDDFSSIPVVPIGRDNIDSFDYSAPPPSLAPAAEETIPLAVADPSLLHAADLAAPPAHDEVTDAD